MGIGIAIPSIAHQYDSFVRGAISDICCSRTEPVELAGLATIAQEMRGEAEYSHSHGHAARRSKNQRRFVARLPGDVSE